MTSLGIDSAANLGREMTWSVVYFIDEIADLKTLSWIFRLVPENRGLAVHVVHHYRLDSQ